MTTADPTVLEFYLKEARARYKRATAFRLGYVIGQAGEQIPCPYPPNTRRAVHFAAGYDSGTQRRKRDKAIARNQARRI